MRAPHKKMVLLDRKISLEGVTIRHSNEFVALDDLVKAMTGAKSKKRFDSVIADEKVFIQAGPTMRMQVKAMRISKIDDLKRILGADVIRDISASTFARDEVIPIKLDVGTVPSAGSVEVRKVVLNRTKTHNGHSIRCSEPIDGVGMIVSAMDVYEAMTGKSGRMWLSRNRAEIKELELQALTSVTQPMYRFDTLVRYEIFAEIGSGALRQIEAIPVARIPELIAILPGKMAAIARKQQASLQALFLAGDERLIAQTRAMQVARQVAEENGESDTLLSAFAESARVGGLDSIAANISAVATLEAAGESATTIAAAASLLQNQEVASKIIQLTRSPSRIEQTRLMIMAGSDGALSTVKEVGGCVYMIACTPRRCIIENQEIVSYLNSILSFDYTMTAIIKVGRTSNIHNRMTEHEQKLRLHDLMLVKVIPTHHDERLETLVLQRMRSHPVLDQIEFVPVLKQTKPGIKLGARNECFSTQLSNLHSCIPILKGEMSSLASESQLGHPIQSANPGGLDPTKLEVFRAFTEAFKSDVDAEYKKRIIDKMLTLI